VWSRSPSVSLDSVPAGTRMPEQAETEARPSLTRKLINFLLESARRWPFVAGTGTLPPVAVDAYATCFSIDAFRLRVRRASWR
jgi:hypothetical protein